MRGCQTREKTNTGLGNKTTALLHQVVVPSQNVIVARLEELGFSGDQGASFLIRLVGEGRGEGGKGKDRDEGLREMHFEVVVEDKLRLA